MKNAMTPEQYTSLRVNVSHMLRLERVRIGLGNMIAAFGRDGRTSRETALREEIRRVG